MPQDVSSQTSRKRVHISTRVMTHPVDFAKNLSLWVLCFSVGFFFLLRGRSQHLSPVRSTRKTEQEGWMARRGKAGSLETPAMICVLFNKSRAVNTNTRHREKSQQRGKSIEHSQQVRSALYGVALLQDA